MASPISPSNGFITRLLQQTTQASTTQNQVRNTPSVMSDKPDSLNISTEARQASDAAKSSQLESKLIALYNQKGEGSR